MIVVTGELDASQVVLPVYQTDAAGNQVLDANGSRIVIGSSNKQPNGAPASSSAATGFATVTLDTSADTITTDLAWSGLSGSPGFAHLHDAPSGQSRLEPPHDRFFHEVIGSYHDSTTGNNLVDSVKEGRVPCSPNDLPSMLPPYYSCIPATGSLHDVLSNISTRGSTDSSGVFTGFYFYPSGFLNWSAFVAAVESDGLFIDIHTAPYPGGENRGQLSVSSVPEPASWAVLAFGVLAAREANRRRRTGHPLIRRSTAVC